jgi:vancomycin permeability regulator SanA
VTIAVLITLVTKLTSLSVSGNMQSEMQFFQRHFLVIAIVVILILAALASHAARFLVVDEPEKSDAIVVLAGETSVRPTRALELLRQGTAPHMFLDAETRDVIYDQRLTDIAQKYVDSLPEANRVSVCPIIGFSTFAEADDVSRCLQPLGAHRVLIVTSDFHTRRALAIFRHRLPQYQFSVAAATGSRSFGDAWWTNREWAKITLDEWMKTLWFECVDRWR